MVARHNAARDARGARREQRTDLLRRWCDRLMPRSGLSARISCVRPVRVGYVNTRIIRRKYGAQREYGDTYSRSRVRVAGFHLA